MMNMYCNYVIMNIYMTKHVFGFFLLEKLKKYNNLIAVKFS